MMNNQMPFSIGLIELALISIIFIPVLFLNWKLVSKTGNLGLLSLLMFVPLVNLGFIIWLTFSEWPLEKRVKELEEQQSGISRR